MANGDIKWFAQGLLDLGNKIHDLDSDDLRVGFITSAVTPALSLSLTDQQAGDRVVSIKTQPIRAEGKKILPAQSIQTFTVAAPIQIDVMTSVAVR